MTQPPSAPPAALPVLGLLFMAAAIAAPSAQAQEPVPEKAGPWRLQTALDLPDGVRVEGSIRPRFEALTNPFVAGRDEDDDYLGLQSLVRGEFDLGASDFTLGGELLDSRFIVGNETGGAASEVDTLEPIQAYLAWRPTDVFADGARLDLTAGRFAMDIGSRRLAARAGFRNIIQAFDGIRSVWTNRDDLAVTLAYVAPTVRTPSDAASAIDNEVALNRSGENVRLGIAHIDAPLPFSLRGELYLFDLDEKDSSEAATRNRNLATVGGRLRRASARNEFDFDVEYARQTGSQRATTSPADVAPLDHEADMAHVEVGFTVDAPWSPRLSLHVDHASGDASPLDAASGRFDNLFGDRSFEFGPTGLYGFIARTNLVSPGFRIEAKPDPGSDAYLMVRQVDLESPRDSLANSGVRDPTGASGTDAGVQLEGRYRWWLVRDSVRLAFGAAALFAGDFLETAPNATRQGDTLYGYSELTWTF